MILVCAATRTELSACERGVADAGRRERFAFLLTGVGAVSAERALVDHLRRGASPDFVISAGFAGARSAGLDVGAWITTTSLTNEGHPVAAQLRPAPSPATSCRLDSAASLVIEESAAEADAVDMESAALARVATTHGLDLMVLRLVSDSRAKPLPRFLSPFTAAMTSRSAREKLGHAARGVRDALGDPRGVARLVRDGTSLKRELMTGWTRFAKTLS